MSFSNWGEEAPSESESFNFSKTFFSLSRARKGEVARGESAKSGSECGRNLLVGEALGVWAWGEPLGELTGLEEANSWRPATWLGR